MAFIKNRLAMFILALIVMLPLLGFIDKFADYAEDQSISQKCQASVERNARYRFANIDLGSNLDCPTRSIVIDGKADDDAREKVANSMYACWKQFGKGELNLFSGNGVYCHVCFLIDVKTEGPITGMGTYLLTEPSPSENLVYYDYLSNFKTSKAEKILGRGDIDQLRLDDNQLTAGKKYAVMFVYAKGHDNFKRIREQVLAQSEEGKIITGIAAGTGITAGVTVAAIAVTAPVSVPVIAIAGAGVAVGAGVFAGVQYAGSFFNPDEPPEWMAFNVLREWGPVTTPKTMLKEFGCTELVETETN